MLKKIFILCSFLATVYFRNISNANQSVKANNLTPNIAETSITDLIENEIAKKIPLNFIEKDQGQEDVYGLAAQGHGSHLP
jgi:hypothetical protein